MGLGVVRMDIETVRHYFNEEKTVEHYARATVNIGLWESEAVLFQKHIEKGGPTLDLGCGAGRVTLGLIRSGFKKVVGVDLAEEMVGQASDVADFLGISATFSQGDATSLAWEPGSFKSVLFAFNGLMQIPGRRLRLKAVREIYRVLEPEGVFVFTSLDRDSPLYSRIFQDPTDPAHDLSQNPNLIDYGDRHFQTDHGKTFMHVPNREEVISLLHDAGFSLVEDCMRSSIAKEKAVVQDFSEDCRFWVAQKPKGR
ncbi:class I SAM-dependent methyltransferase [Puniceicoccaceae bacterium K14]|nr:class I SAM-dependent methyltransferase [Puniceicoccaceae bacterium K14]